MTTLEGIGPSNSPDPTARPITPIPLTGPVTQPPTDEDPHTRWTLVALFATAILVGSLIPLQIPLVDPPEADGEATRQDPPLDAIAHLVGYFVLTAGLLYALRQRPPLQAAALAATTATAFGLLIEILQAPLPHRHFSPTDILANAIGAVTAVLVWLGARFAKS